MGQPPPPKKKGEKEQELGATGQLSWAHRVSLRRAKTGSRKLKHDVQSFRSFLQPEKNQHLGPPELRG